MKCLFTRVFDGHHVKELLPEVQEGCEWVLDPAVEVMASEKIDGSCCMIKDNVLYKRFDYKVGRKLPEGAIPCQEKADPITGHFPHWVKVSENNPSDKYHISAFKEKDNWEDGTYEIIGPHFQGNPYNLEKDILEKHGQRVIENPPRDFESIKKYLEDHIIEGIVFKRLSDGLMCKIRRRDYGFMWNGGDERTDQKLNK